MVMPIINSSLESQDLLRVLSHCKPTLLRRGSPTVQAKTREKKKAEPLPHNVRFSAQKSRFLACATITTVQTQEGEFVQCTHVIACIVGFIMETRGRELSLELLRVQTTLSQD